jgi:pyridoxamine 5'-phosphate oxidase
MKDLAALRRDYALAQLDESHVFEDPYRQFAKWWEEALASEILEPNAMTLATATADGTPSARVVLLKGFDQKGFKFYTNYASRKGEEMLENPRVSLVFLWGELERQVRIEGLVDRLSEEESTEYFQSRPKESQIGAWVSQQSQKIASRAVLEAEYARLAEQYAHVTVLPKPPHWGGFVVKPYKMEFWQGRSSRLHDRILYTLTELQPQVKWTVERLAP